MRVGGQAVGDSKPYRYSDYMYDAALRDRDTGFVVFCVVACAVLGCAGWWRENGEAAVALAQQRAQQQWDDALRAVGLAPCEATAPRDGGA